jgi:hypothetical protein
MLSRIFLLTVPAIGLFLASGCSGRDDTPSTPSAPPAAPSSAPAEPAPTTASATPSVNDGVLEVGKTHAFTGSDGEKVAVTLLAHKAGEDDYYGIQVRTCNNGAAAFNASTLPWLLSYSGGEELSQDTIIGGGVLEPAFNESELEPGKCRKGWITFELAGKPDGAEYRVEGETSARWEW